MLKNIKMLMLFTVVLLFIIFLPQFSYAANAKINVNANGEVNKEMTITVSGSAVQWNLELKVDGKTIATSRELDNYESNKNISFSGKYTPTSVGNKVVTLEGTITEFSDGSTIRNFESKKINVKEATTPTPTPTPTPTTSTTPSPEPETAKLSKLVVGGSTKTVKKNMSVTVEGQTEITIKPTTNKKVACTVTNSNNGSKVTINSGKSGTVKLDEGTNRITIAVKDGESYTLTVYNTKKEEEEPGNVIDETVTNQQVSLKSLQIEGFTLTPEFASDVYEYNITIPEDKNDINKLDIKALGNSEDLLVEITGNEDLKDGENIITILVSSTDGTTTATYQIKVVKEPKTVTTVASNTETIPQTQQEVVAIWSKPRAITISVLTAIIAIAGIVFAVIEYRYTKEENKEKNADITYSKIGFKKIDNNDVEDQKEDDSEVVQDEEQFEKIDDNKFENQEEKEERKTKRKKEKKDISFEKLEDDKQKNKGKHF